MINNNDKEEFVMALAGNKSDLDPTLKKISVGMANELA